MTLIEESRRLVPGGSFLIEEFPPEALFSPDNLDEEHRMIQETARRFMLEEVLPKNQRIEEKEPGLMVSLLRKAGELGLLGAEFPEEYGGLGLDRLSTMLITEEFARQGSWAVSIGGHCGIGSLPIVYFGTPEQRQKYLPRLATGELLACYALTEPHSGSDALAARTRAELTPDGKHYLLNGQKMWITNAGFADIFIVFAKVDGQHFTAFIVEKGFPGISTGAEEKKMGLLGSSTRAVVLENCQVPVENVLGEIGKGHKIALNILNIGRFKLGAGAIGSCKHVINDSIRYALQREQFGRPIAEFGAIQHKLAQMVVLTWVGESMNYRTAGLIDNALKSVDRNDYAGILRNIEEYAAECAILKVMNSESLDFCVDEMVQIYGGYGYSKEYPAEQAYRDSRINRIFEGTNEINRLTIVGMLLKRSMAGRLPLLDALMEVQQELEKGYVGEPLPGLLGRERSLVAAAKKATLLCAGLVVNAVGFDSPEEKHQEVLMGVADMVMEVYAQDSALLRCLKLAGQRGLEGIPMQLDILRTFLNDSGQRLLTGGMNLLAAVLPEGEREAPLAHLRQLLGQPPVDTVAMRRRIARRVLEEGKYVV